MIGCIEPLIEDIHKLEGIVWGIILAKNKILHEPSVVSLRKQSKEEERLENMVHSGCNSNGHYEYWVANSSEIFLWPWFVSVFFCDRRYMCFSIHPFYVMQKEKGKIVIDSLETRRYIVLTMAERTNSLEL